MSSGMVESAGLLILKVAIVSFLAGGGAYWIFSAWMNRTLSIAEAGGLMAGLVVATFFLVSFALDADFAAIFALLLIVAAGVFGVWQYSHFADRRLSNRFDEEDIARYLEAIDLDPSNAAAHSLLGDMYRKQQKYEQALHEYEEAVRISPELQEERYWIARLKDKLARIQYADRPGEEMDTPCPACRAIVPGYAERCQECGEYLGKA